MRFKQSNKNCSWGRDKTLKILPVCGSAVHTALHRRDVLTHAHSPGACRRVLSLHNFLAAASSTKCFWVTEDVNAFFKQASGGVKLLQHTNMLQLNKASLNSSETSERASCASRVKDYPSTGWGFRVSKSNFHIPDQADTGVQLVSWATLN